MAESGNGDGAQAATAGTAGQGQEPAGAPQGTPNGQKPKDDEGKPPEFGEHTAYIESLRQENARHRAAANAATAKATELERSQMTEAQKLQAERDEATARAEELATQLAEVKRSRHLDAALSDALNPATALRVLDTSSVEWDDDGKPQGKSLERAVEALRKSDPYLFKRQAPAGGGAAGAGGGQQAPAPRTGTLTSQGVNDLVRTRGQSRQRL